MKNKFPLESLNLSDRNDLQSLVEHRKVYSLNHCELSIFETYRQCNGVALTYDGLTISSMLRGKKVIRLFEEASFDFLPGETVILPEGVCMKVDFPEADDTHPVQCATLAIDGKEVARTLAYLNETYRGEGDTPEWALNFNRYHFNNTPELSYLIHKLISISMEDVAMKDALADLALKELIIRAIQTQHLATVKDTVTPLPESNRFTSVIHYIREHLTAKIPISTLCREACMSKSSFFRAFKKTFGLSPIEYINGERVNLAKRLLNDQEASITEVCYQTGFKDLSYFVRLFKLTEGMTPKSYQQAACDKKFVNPRPTKM